MKRKKTYPRCASIDRWEQDEARKYLWRNDFDDIQVMTFTNDVDPMLVCLWIKIYDGKDYVSNYFIYDRGSIDEHPLDYALNIREEFLKQQYKDKE